MGVVQVARQVANLVFPVQCAGCRAWDENLCDSCAALARNTSKPKYLEDSAGVPYAPLVTLGPYEDALRNIILQAKHDPNHNLDEFLVESGKTLGKGVLSRLNEAFAPTNGIATPVEEVWVVGAPSSRSRKWKRMEIVPLITEGVRAALSTSGLPCQVVDAVSMRLFKGSQAGKSEMQRRLSRDDALKLVAKPEGQVVVVLVDDVVTTGATMRQMARLLHPHVLVAAALAAAV